MFSRMSLVPALILGVASLAGAQAPIDPAGHWEGTIAAPNRSIAVELDFVRNGKGELEATLAIPEQRLKGLPLANLSVDGSALRFQLGKNAGDRSYTATLSADGSTMTGDYTQEGHAMPFTATRKGDARVMPRPRSAPVGQELAGTWNGTLNVDSIGMRVQLVIVNEADGASGTLANLDQGGVEVPIAVITQKASAVTLDVAAVDGSYAGELKADGSEIIGTWTQGTFTAPLILKRGR
jgi:hypothetical protein